MDTLNKPLYQEYERLTRVCDDNTYVFLFEIQMRCVKDSLRNIFYLIFVINHSIESFALIWILFHTLYILEEHWKLFKRESLKKRNSETGGFFNVVYFHFRAHAKSAKISSAVAASERDSPRLRMTLEFFVRVSGTMMRSYFMKGKKQKFGSTLSTVIDVYITCKIVLIEFKKKYSYLSYEFTIKLYKTTNTTHFSSILSISIYLIKIIIPPKSDIMIVILSELLVRSLYFIIIV